MCGVVDTCTIALDNELSGGLNPPVSVNLSFENLMDIKFGGNLYMRVTLERVQGVINVYRVEFFD